MDKEFYNYIISHGIGVPISNTSVKLVSNYNENTQYKIKLEITDKEIRNITIKKKSEWLSQIYDSKLFQENNFVNLKPSKFLYIGSVPYTAEVCITFSKIVKIIQEFIRLTEEVKNQEKNSKSIDGFPKQSTIIVVDSDKYQKYFEQKSIVENFSCNVFIHSRDTPHKITVLGKKHPIVKSEVPEELLETKFKIKENVVLTKAIIKQAVDEWIYAYSIGSL